MRTIAQSHGRVNQTKWPILAEFELWILGAAAPFLLFPGRWTPAALAAIALTWVLRRLAFGAFTVRTPADAPLLFLLLGAAAGLYFSPDRSAAADAFWRLLLGVAVFYGLANGVRHRRGLWWLSLALATGGLGLVVLTLLGTRWDAVRLMSLPDLYGRLPELLRDPQDGQPFHPRVMAMGLATLFPPVLAITVFGQDRRLRLAAGVAALAIALMLLLTQPVQALLGAGCALLFLAVVWSRWCLLLPVVAVAAGVALVLALRYDLAAFASRMLSVGDVAGIGVALRLDMWGRALAMIHDMPFTGIGLNAFPVIQINFYPGYLLGPEPHAHSLYLQLALDLGLPGLLAFLWMLVAACGMALATYRHPGGTRDERALLVGAAAGVVSFLGAGLIDTPSIGKPGILLWALLGTLAAAHRLLPAREERPAGTDSHRLRSLLPWIAPPAALVLALVALPGARAVNVASLAAHRALLDVRSVGQADLPALRVATSGLQAALPQGRSNPHVHNLLGSLLAWQGAGEEALAALERQVAIDLDDPFGRYAPFEALRRRITGDPAGGSAPELLKVYGQWMARFPSRAETYAAAAIVYEETLHDADRARQTLESGLKQNAQPSGLLEYYLARLSAGR